MVKVPYCTAAARRRGLAGSENRPHPRAGVNGLFRIAAVSFCGVGEATFPSLGDKKMKTSRKISFWLVGVSLAGSLLAQEKKIERSELPAAVQKAVAEQTKGAT